MKSIFTNLKKFNRFVICFVIIFAGVFNSYGQSTENFKSPENVKFSDKNVINDYLQFLENQKIPLLTANGEAFRLDSLVWQRKYGEKEYYLSPVMKNISEYNKRIRQLDDNKNRIIKSKFHLLNVEITPLSKSLLKSMNINVPDYVKNNVNVYLPEIDIDVLNNNGVNYNILENYGKNTGEIIETKGTKSTIWSEGWEGSLSDYTRQSLDGAGNDCYWGDVSCLQHSGGYSLWCADDGADAPSTNCSDYVNNMQGVVLKPNTIDISCYDNINFAFYLYYETEYCDDYVILYFYDGYSTTQQALYCGTSEVYWNQKSFTVTGSWNEFSWSFLFYSDWIGSSKEGAYIDDMFLTGTPCGQPGTATVSGTSSACQGESKTYTASASGATSYIWSLPSGWSGSSTSSSITVTVGSSSGNVCAKGHNSCGDGSQGCKYVTVNHVPGTATVSGSSSACQGENKTYTASTSGATSYIWYLPSGWSGSSTSSSINVTVGSSSDYVCAKGHNSCGDGSPGCKYVTVNHSPGTATVSGSSSACQGESKTYTASASGATSYIWSLPSGWSGSSTSSSINVTVGSSSGNVCAKGHNSCGDGSQGCKAVTVNHVPGTATVSGSSSACEGESKTYTASASGATSYSWSATGCSPSSGSGSSFTTTIGSSSVNICATPSNSCGNGSQGCKSVTVTQLPGAATVSGSGSACEGSTETYNASSDNATSYTWTLPSGWSGSSTSNSITVTVGNSSGDVCATPHNSCGDGSQGCKSVTVTQLPGAPTGVTASDDNSNKVTITWNNVSGATKYKITRDATILTESCTSTSYDDNDASPGQTYSYCVYAGNDCGWSGSACDDGIRPNEPYLNISGCPESNLSQSSGNFTINVSSNVTWSISEDCDWVTVNPTSASNDGSVIVSYNEYTETSERTCTITVSGEGENDYCTFTQDHVPCTTPGTPSANNPSSITQTESNFSWSAGNPVGSPTVTYYWAVGTSSSVTYESDYTKRGTTTGTTSSTDNLNPSTTYYFRVKACTNCDNTCSGYSSYKEFNDIDDINDNSSIKIYPNPATNTINIVFEDKSYKDVKVSLLNIQGQTISGIKQTSVNSNTLQLNLSNCSNGIYYLNIQIDKGTIIRKISVMK